MALDYDVHFLPAYDRAFVPKRPRPNQDQRDAILDTGDVLFLVAGPGSGKTTVLTLRILFKVLCTKVPPNTVLATTFTVKAAGELRSRILGWGFALRDQLLADKSVYGADRAWLEEVDINQVTTGTLDSICQDVLSQNRAPAAQPPVVVDDFLARTVMLKSGLFAGNRYKDADLDAWLMQVRGSSAWGWNIGEKRKVLSSIWDRLQQDLTDVNALAGSGVLPKNVRPALVDALNDYNQELTNNHWLDFGMLERRVLDDLRAGSLQNWVGRFRELLVDEYQDTNLLQEKIYFELIGRGGAGLTVVGDDDQSLYRFRGTAVDLFRDFPNRLKKALKKSATTRFLATNYRSTDPIIDFADSFITRDIHFQSERVAQKPRILSPNPGKVPGPAVLGIFRPDPDSLATEVANFIVGVTSGHGISIGNGDRLRIDSGKGGALGDLCVLMSSPQEFKRAAPAGPGAPAPPEARFPALLREKLANRIRVFNPRGSPLSEVQSVQQLGGLLLECLDDRGMVQASDKAQKRMGPDAKRLFPIWRNAGRAKQRSITGLNSYVKTWQTRSTPAGYRWPTSVPVLDVLYGLVHYLPEFHDDPEGQCFLEVFARQLHAMSGLSKFKGRVVTNPGNPGVSDASVRDLLCDWLSPIASNSVELDEGMIGSFPRDRLSILSIHQSKGLEFPLVLVDSGSDFKSNHHTHAFKRFPKSGAISHTLEDLIRPLSGEPKPKRTAQWRAFDDLERQFYVAFTRAQQVLVLFGLEGSRPDNASVQNVAAGWDRAKTRHGQNWKVTYL